MTEQTTTTTDKDHNSGEVIIPSSRAQIDKAFANAEAKGEVTKLSPKESVDRLLKDSQLARTKKETTPRKRATRAKSTSKRKPAGARSTLKNPLNKKERKTNSKAKTTKAKPTTTKATPHGDEIARNWKERLRKVSDKKGKEISSKSKETKAKKETKTKVTKEEKGEKAKLPTSLLVNIGQLGTQHQVVLYTMSRVGSEMTYGDLSSEIGLSRAVLRKVINSQTDKDSLVSMGLVAVDQYETEVGEYSSPYYFRLTDTGKKLVS